jgi:hypothetical protein
LAGAPVGNDNAARGAAFNGALRRQLAEAGKDRERLLEIAEQLILKAESGDLQAIKEVADRLDGKAPQAITGPDGGPMQLETITRRIVDPRS